MNTPLGMSKLAGISKRSILMYAGAVTVAGIAFMLVTGIMGSSPVFYKASVTVEDTEEAKAKGISPTYDDVAMPIDDSILARFPRSDEFKKALEELGDFKRTCNTDIGGGLYGLYKIAMAVAILM